ncbi:MAG: tRNA 2-thiouridine(34) synthase MnmA [Candidatus Magasanikbacteria bacterium]|nr:tRNA 2-thiouridine(34) synthase MnmA [Candidatus Magasanikbacteria bacterium]
MNSENAQKTVYIGLSGVVDSAVSAYLLVEAGYNVVAIFMKNFSQEIMVNGQMTECWVPEWHDALRVAAHLKIPLQRWDFETEYRRDVYEYFKKEYAAGRTPNPDVLCNSQIKFGAFYEAARAAGADYIATGHYAQVGSDGELLRAVDDDKDQTYFLNSISREALRHTLFPIGHLQKSDVREIARAAGLPVAEKKDSTGICFVGEVPIKELLADTIKPRPGKIMTTAGEEIGEHDGLTWYTIGQRHGFGATGGRAALFVVGKNFETNELIVGDETDPALFSLRVTAREPHWIDAPVAGDVLFARFRHRQPLQKVASWKIDGNVLILEMVEPQRAITPGQFGNRLTGGIFSASILRIPRVGLEET